MEFDELKKVWDSQNNEPIYGVNEQALHNRIISKKESGNKITNISELLSIVVNLGAGLFILTVNIAKHSGNVFMYLLSGWMMVTALYALVSRIKRKDGNNKFDRSLQGDLQHAIAMATYQVRFSLLMRWNIVPVGILLMLGVWDSGKSIWLAAGILVFFVLTNYAAGWEHRIYKDRRRELETLAGALRSEA